VSTEVSPRRVRMDRADRRRQILRVAARLFGERPYSEVSVNDIAGEAGIARGLMHHYFGSKRELYLEVVRLSAQAPRLPRPDDSLDVEQAWTSAVDGFLGMIARNPTLWLNAVTVGGAERDDEVAAILDEALTLTTFCSGTGRCWAERRTSLVGSRGASIEAVSLWIRIDPATGGPLSLGDDFSEVYGAAAGGRRTLRARGK